MTRSVILIPDAITGADSGAVAARTAARLISELGWRVIVFANCSDVDPVSVCGFEIAPRPPSSARDHIFGSRQTSALDLLLDSTHATSVFFLGTMYSKAAGLFRVCRKRGVRTIAMPWAQDVYCNRFYAALEDGPCERCLSGTFLPALRNRCSYGADKSLIAIASASAVRTILRSELLRCNILLASTDKQLQIFNRLGATPDQAIKCPLFFDRSRTDTAVSPSSDGQYFVCYGQSRMEKGWHLLARIVEASGSRFVLPFMDESIARNAVAQFGLAPLVASGQVEIRTNLSWDTGVKEIVAQSRGVLIPSLWPTTTEFTLLESLGLGKPVIAFDVGIHSEVLRHRENGMLAPVGDPITAGNHIREVDLDASLRSRVSRGARQLFDDLTSRTTYLRALEKVFEASGLQ